MTMLLTAAAPSQAQSDYLERIEVSAGAEGSQIEVKFNLPLQYESHTPETAGRELRVTLRPLGSGQSAPRAEDYRETLSWKADDKLPLSEALLEASSGTKFALTLRFTRRVKYRVEAGRNLRSLIVTLEPTARPSTTAATSPTASQAAQSSPATPKVKPKARLAPNGRLHPYTINLMSSVRPINPADLPRLDIPQELRLYSTQFETGGKTWNRLRLGFFSDRKAAQKTLASIRLHYPDAWVAKATRREWEVAQGQSLTPSGPRVGAPAAAPAGVQPQATPESAVSQALPRITPQKSGEVMTDARAAMTAGDLRRAIQLLTKALGSSDEKVRRDAKELLGLARERNGQLAHAKAEYEEYIALYPQGEGTERVKQRLAGILTARAAPREKLGQPGDTAFEDDPWDYGVAGSLSQFYRRDESFTDIEGRTTNISELNSDLDLIAHARSDAFDVTFRATGGYVWDFLKDGESESRLANLFGEFLAPQQEIFAKLGRQTRSTDGILGRFDGAFLSYQVLPEVQVNLVGGLPVDRTTDLELNEDRYFAGISTDLGTFLDSLDLNVYFINQFVNGITDRRAVGAETRYFDAHRSAFLLLDYDISYSALNLAVFGGTWIFPDQTALNLALDYRKSPLLTTSNALQGQTAETISDLLDDFSRSEVRDLAEDRTAQSRSMTLGLSRPLNETFQIAGDFTISKFSSTESSGGVEGTPSTGNEYFYAAQLISTGLVAEGDIMTFGVRYADTDTSDRYTVDLNTRFPVTREFRVAPRIQTNYRDNKNADLEEYSVRPSVRLTYFWKRILQPELEIGGEWRKERRDGVTDDSYDFFVNVGYRLDF